MDCDLDTSIPDWVIDHPETTPVFERWGLDLACGGKSLRYLCQTQGLSPPAVLQSLREAIEDRANDN